MTMTQKLILSCFGTFIGGAGMYWQQVTPDQPLDVRLWISLVMAGLVPLGTYFIGLSQRAPWEGPTLPTRTEESTAVTRSPRSTTTTEKKITVTDPPPDTDDGDGP